MFHMSAEGFKEAAEKFQSEAGVQPSVPLHTLDNRILIREAVMASRKLFSVHGRTVMDNRIHFPQGGRVQLATHLVNQLHPELLDNNRYLYFHMQQQHLIELIR